LNNLTQRAGLTGNIPRHAFKRRHGVLDRSGPVGGWPLEISRNASRISAAALSRPDTSRTAAASLVADAKTSPPRKTMPSGSFNSQPMPFSRKNLVSSL
jgi:hypothetical protein